MLQNLFRSHPSKAQGRALYGSAAEKARDASFYRALGAPDRIDARFELFSLHVALVLERLRDQGEEAADVAQETLDTYVRSLDDALREQGIGDLSMRKKMKTVAGLVMGRIAGVREALLSDDREAMAGLVARSLPDLEPNQAKALAAYVFRAHEALQAQPLRDILDGRPAWPRVQP